MSLFSSIQLAGNSLQAQQIGLQVVGQNIANANTPGYIREEAIFQPAPTQQDGNLLLGMGVQVSGIKQQVDNLLGQRLLTANSDAANATTQQSTYQQVESLVNALGDNNLSSSLNNFFSSINDVLNQPDSTSVRNLAVLSGQTLSTDINQLASRVSDIRSDLNNQIIQDAGSINQLVTQIAQLNSQIAQSEGATASKSQAVGLRDQRNQAETALSNLIDIKVSQQPDGTDTIYAGGDYLVSADQARLVKVVSSSDQGQVVSQIRFASPDGKLNLGSGEIAGLIQARDGIAGGFISQLNSFANTLAFEFNQVYSSGQGLTGYQQLTSTNLVAGNNQPLDAAGLVNSPVNGSFQIQVLNTKTGLTQSSNIQVNLNGLDSDTSLNGLASQINAVDGLSATVSANGQLSIQTTSSDLQFSFANDTSHALAALGINTFFTGTNASALAVNSTVAADPGKFAASSTGIGADTQNATTLASFLDQPLESANGDSIGTLYNQLVSGVTQGSAQAQSAASGATVFQQSLQAQQMAISGVSIDDEAIQMIQFQRAYEASAKYISTLNELLNVLVQL